MWKSAYTVKISRNRSIGIANQVKEEAEAAAAASKEAVEVAAQAAQTAENYKELIEDIYNNTVLYQNRIRPAVYKRAYIRSSRKEDNRNR